MRFTVLCACAAALLTTAVLAQEATGPVTIGGITYDHVDPGEPFTRAAVPEQDWEAPTPNRAERAAGMMPYVTSDPGDYKPYRIPRAEERVAKLSAFLTPGEDEPVWVGVYALAGLEGLSVRVDPGSAPVTVDVRHEHFWPQRTGWRSRRWYITPELLLPCADGMKLVPAKQGVLREVPFNLGVAETAAFWLTLTAAPDASPGSYKATVTVSSEDRPQLALPLNIEVLPFTLQRPADRYWLLYCDQARWRRMSDEQVQAELRDFARHGMNGLVEGPLGSPDLSEIKSGKVTFDASPYRRLAGLCEEAGLPGPHVCSMGGMPARVREALGVPCDLAKDTWPKAVSDGVAAVSRAAVEATKDLPQRWYFYGVDEPGGDNTYAIQEYQSWRRGGAETYATFYNLGFLEKASEYLTAPCFVTGLISAEHTARAAREACEKTGAEFWWYGTGSYVNHFPQEGYMFHNRYGAGFLFWKTGAKGEVSWTFCRPHEDVFNDFDGSRQNAAEPKEQATSYPHLLKPNDWSTYQGAIPTIAWESLREGVDDYRYLHTLTKLIAQAQESPKATVRQQAAKTQETLQALVEGMPWANPMGGVAFETKRMQQMRRAVAQLTMDLQAAMAGRAVKGAARPDTPFTLKVRVTKAQGADTGALPVIPVAMATRPPAIDGRLDDECWQGAAVAGDFRDSRSGLATEAPTRAMILTDDRALYVAFDCHEPLMDKLVARQKGHDTPLVWLDDGIELFLAGEDRNQYAHFIVNTNGSIYDEVKQNPEWDPRTEVKVSKGTASWAVELALPWAQLHKIGITRTPAMAANFCRNRFAGGANPHSAWSCTFGGFHAPHRFGLALLQAGEVMLTDLRLPSLWGRQPVTARLQNATDAPLTARVQVGRRRSNSVALPAGAAANVSVPMGLLKPGTRPVRLAWGVEGQPLHGADITIVTPEPIAATPASGFVSHGDVLEVPVQSSVAPRDRPRYRILTRVSTGGVTQTLALPPEPGQEGSLRVSASGAVHVETFMANVGGEQLGRKFAGVLFPAP